MNANDDDLDAFRHHVEHTVEVALKALPASSDALSTLRRLRDDAADAARITLGLTYCHPDKASDGFNGLNASNDDSRALASPSNDAFAALLSTLGGVELARERAGERRRESGTTLWRSCDGVVFVASSAKTRREMTSPTVVDRSERVMSENRSSRDASTQCPELTFELASRESDGRTHGSLCTNGEEKESMRAREKHAKALGDWGVSEVIGEIARVVASLGEKDVFVVCEGLDENTDERRGRDVRDALSALTGIDAANVLFCAKSFAEALEEETGERERDEASSSDGRQGQDRGGGWFAQRGGAKKRVNAMGALKSRLASWRAKLRRDRAAKYRDAEYEIESERARFWASFLRLDDASVTEDAAMASVESSEALTEAVKFEHQSMATMHKFLKIAIEGVPAAGIPGAQTMAWRHFQKYPKPDRAPLMRAASSLGVIEYAAAVVSAWLTPGPMGALAAHLINRFRACLFLACLSGASVLDPAIVSTALALAAGADKEHLEMSPVIRFVANVEGDSSDEESGAEDDYAEALTVTVDGEIATMTVDGEIAEGDQASSSTSSPYAGLSTLMRAALDRSLAEDSDLKCRASKTLAKLSKAANRAVLKSRRRAMKIACDAKAEAISAKKLAYDDAEAMARRVFGDAFARDVAREVSALICGPKFLTHEAHDVANICNSTFAEYVAAAALDIFLPMVYEHEAETRALEAKATVEAEAAAAVAARAAVAALTTKNAFVTLTLKFVCRTSDRIDGDGVIHEAATTSDIVAEADYVECALAVTRKPGVVEQFFYTSKVISAKTAALTTSTAEVAKSSAEAVSEWATKTTDSVFKETNRGIELASENAKASIESAKIGLESASAFLARTTSSLKESATSSASSISTAFGALTASDGSVETVSIDVRSLPAQRIVAALESAHVDRVIVEYHLLLKMPIDLVFSKELKDVVAELREDSSKFIAYKDDETVTRAIQRLLELVVETGDRDAIAELTKLGVIPRPKSKAQAKLEALRDQFRRDAPSAASASSTENGDETNAAADVPIANSYSRILSAVDPRTWTFAFAPKTSPSSAGTLDAESAAKPHDVDATTSPLT